MGDRDDARQVRVVSADMDLEIARVAEINRRLETLYWSPFGPADLSQTEWESSLD